MSKHNNKPVSLAPLTVEEALKALLQTKPELEKPKATDRKQKNQKPPRKVTNGKATS